MNDNIIIFLSYVVVFVQYLISHPPLGVVFLIELFPLFFMMVSIKDIIMEQVAKKIDKILMRCVYDEEYRNDTASLIFFFVEMGPSISSFSAIALFTTTKENFVILTIIFFFGIIVKQRSRRVKNRFYSEIKKRS